MALVDGGRTDGSRGLRAALARHALLPLRLFLGGTFVYAGLDKLTDPGFLASSGPGSLAEVLEGVRQTAGATWIVDLALNDPSVSATPSRPGRSPSDWARWPACGPGSPPWAER
jgi:hypothetical protein